MSPQTIHFRDSSLILRAFESLLAQDPEATALIDGSTGRITSRDELQTRAGRIADQLRDAGVAAGDIVAVQFPNSVDFVAAFVASLHLRATFVPIDRDARESEIASVLNHFSARALLYRAQRGESGLPGISTRDVPAVEIANEYVPLLKLSSGSTGRPKGIITTERNLLADCSNICSTMGIRRDDLNLGAIPFSHSYGFSNLVMPLLVQGTPVVFSNDYLPLSIVELCNRFHCTVVPGIPMMYEHLAQLPKSDGMFATVRTFLSAGAPLTASASSRFRERFGIPIHTFYGCSECGGISYDREGGAVERHTVGTPMDGVEVRIDSGEGRLLVSSDAVALGFFRGGSEDAGRFVGGTLRTDDLAFVNERGELTLTGRVGELINTAGKKVNPREVELIIQQISGVRQVKVYGEPAGARGDVVAAAVVADPDVTREAIREYCHVHLSSHKVPRIVKLIENIPVDERGKVKRSELALL